jgi:hypothetical protein
VITIKLHIKSLSDVDYIINKQKNYSYCFRKLYKNINLIKNPKYLKELKSNFSLTDIELRSIISEVKSKFKQIETSKSKLEDEIVLLTNDINELKKKSKSNKNTRRIIKLTKKLNIKNELLPKDIVFGGKFNLTKLSFLNNDKIINKNEILNVKKEYEDNRLLPIFLLGEANQTANRFFKFDLKNNKIIYKPNKNTKINIEFTNYKSYKNTLLRLQDYINNKLISVSIRLSKDYIYLIFDDEILNGYSLNEVERTKEVKKIKKSHISKEVQSKLIKELYKKYYREQEDKKLKDKLSYRYLAIDTNPDFIGCSILDESSNVIIKHTFYYDLRELNNIKLGKSSEHKDNIHLNNKRKHGIFHVWKDIFEIFKYYNCGYLVLEDLNIKDKDLGNKTANRKVNNVWYRELSESLINKYCNKLGIIKIMVNPCYSSFIGNMMYDYTDCVNASIEIGRRGIFKYTKDKFYPKLEVGTIMNAMSKLNELRDVSIIKDYGTWVKVYREVHKSGLRYRATLDDTSYFPNVVNNIIHSNIKKIWFSQEKCLSLNINS